MNAQRRGVYGRRQNALKGERIGTDIANMVYEVAQGNRASRGYEGGFEEFDEQVRKSLAIESPVSADEYAKMDSVAVADRLADEAMQNLSRKREKMAEGAAPYIKEFVEERGATGLVGVPVTDGRCAVQHPCRHRRILQQWLQTHRKGLGKGRAPFLYRQGMAGTAA